MGSNKRAYDEAELDPTDSSVSQLPPRLSYSKIINSETDHFVEPDATTDFAWLKNASASVVSTSLSGVFSTAAVGARFLYNRVFPALLQSEPDHVLHQPPASKRPRIADTPSRSSSSFSPIYLTKTRSIMSKADEFTGKPNDTPSKRSGFFNDLLLTLKKTPQTRSPLKYLMDSARPRPSNDGTKGSSEQQDNNHLNAARRTFTPLRLPGAQDEAQESPLKNKTAASSPQKPIYGTFLDLSVADTSTVQAKDQETFGDRLRNSFHGTYVPPKMSGLPTLSFADPGMSNRTRIVTQMSRQLRRNPRRPDDILQRLEMGRQREMREMSLKKWNEDSKLPIEEKPQAERARLYEEIIARTVSLRKGLKELRDREAKVLEKVEPLPAAEIARIEKLWQRNRSQEVVVSAFKIDITLRDLATLADRTWLNDNVIDFYLSLVTERSSHQANDKLPSCFSFSTHFFTTLEGPQGYKGVERWAKRKKVDVTQMDYVFVPINRRNTHWCLAVINNKAHSFEFYDSMGSSGGPALELLQSYMVSESARVHASDPEKQDYYQQLYLNYVFRESVDCPQQENGSDCGVFTCKNVEYLARGVSLSFTQKDMPMFRRKMAFEIVQKHLLQ